jgi:chemotaxis protein MotB
VLFDRQDPQSPINRRISIVIMTKQAEEDALKTDVADATPVSSEPALAPMPTVTSPPLAAITSPAG